MLNLSGMIKAPSRFEVTMKPIGMSRRVNKAKPEYVVELAAPDRDAAATAARQMAATEGINNYSVTKVREIFQ